MKKTLLVLLLTLTTFLFANESHHMHHSPPETALKEAGNDAFGTIQEVIQVLNNNPHTNWKEVNIEALRQHLVDMHDMTFNVNVLSQQPIENGVLISLKATTARAQDALTRVFKAHPMMLEKESGWKMDVKLKEGMYTLTITTSKLNEVDKIRGLGYIGIMAWGGHHQPHHWMMATGKNPH